MSRSFVSVLIDTYNHEKFIEQAITSVLEQDFPASDREILVVNDGSTDRTPEIVKKFEPQVRLLRKQNGGQASAFNAGIPQCRGEVIAFLDGDDWWAPGKLKTVLSEFTAHPEIGAVGNGLFEVDEQGKQLFQTVADRRYSCGLHSLEEARQFLALRSFLGTSRLAVRRSILDRIIPLPEGLLVEADEFLFTMAAALSGCIVVEQPLTFYRYHSNNQFQFTARDDRRRERKFIALDCLARELPARLLSAGVSAEIVEFLTLPNWVDATRARLALGRGWSWETVRVEHRAFRNAYSHSSLGYRCFHAAVLLLAGLLPPRIFYRVRDSYSERKLSRIRQSLGTVTPVSSVAIRKPHHS